MNYKIIRQNDEAIYLQSTVWIFKMAIGTVSVLLIAAAILCGFYFSLLTSGVFVSVALLAAWISAKLRD